MAGANSNIQLSSLDFNEIKQNFTAFLQSQDTFKDYNFEGSALSVLLDTLAYNTQYNAYYLNQVASEMFLDSAQQRSSVISRAKELNYTPKSAIAPTAYVNVLFNNVTDASLTMPIYTHFISESVDGINFTFATTDSYTVNTDVANNTVLFENVEIKQGSPVSKTYTYDAQSNPNAVFVLPDDTIDTTTLVVRVQKSGTDTTSSLYLLADSIASLTGDSQVYFLEESMTGKYQIYFGDGILGKQLVDGNIVRVTYLSTEGTLGAGANSFVLMDTINGYASSITTSMVQASTGGNKETVEQIKFIAPKAFATQGRAVTKDDYITMIQQNKLGFSFDAVNVWGGEENDPPVYGQVFVSLKPTGSYSLTPTQKQKIVKDVIAPISLMTVSPTVVDPDYNYIQVNSNILYNPKLTSYTSSQIGQLVVSAIQQFSSTKLNTFNSTFTASDLIAAIQGADKSIITNDTKIRLQKKFFPSLSNPTTYNLYYNTPLKRGVLTSGVGSSPALKFIDPQNAASSIDGVYIEETPSVTGGVSTINLLNPGFNYTSTPTVTILGDGTGATAEAVVVAGTISYIQVTNAGTGYTQAVVVITPAEGDNSGTGGSAIAVLEGQYGTLRTYYYNSQNVKTVLNDNVGTIDYINGIITLKNFNPQTVDNELGQLTISVEPSSTIINSTLNKILSVDTFDPNAVLVNVTSKT